MNILGIDFGTKNIGLAWLDENLGVILPYGIVKNIGQNAFKEISNLVKSEKINLIVIGLPVPDNKNKVVNITRVKNFVSELKKHVKIPFEFIDERFSSAQADSMGGAATRDEKSAMIILQSYIDEKNFGNKQKK
jgi:putative Holliday junction resolvase